MLLIGDHKMITWKFGNFFKATPGWLVFGMTAIWLAPFCIRDMTQFPLIDYWNSHILYAILFGAAILAMITLNGFESATGFWSRAGTWARFFYVCGGYALAMIASLVAILSLDSARILHYYGGDSGGSPGLLIIPTVLIYSFIGVTISIVKSARR